MLELSRRQVLATAGASAATMALAACGGDDDSGDDDSLSGNRVGAMSDSDYKVGTQFKATEPLDFTLLYNNHPNYPIKKDWLFWEELKKRTNVTFATTEVPLSDYNNKRQLIVSSGDSPLIIPKTYPGQESPFVASGAILPVSDYIDLMPNFKDKIAKWSLKADLDSLRQEDGKFYLLPGVHEDVWIDYTFTIRQDVFEKNNIPIPKTWDDLYTVLKALKALNPAAYPFSERFNQTPPNQPAGSLFAVLGHAYNVYLGWDSNNKAASWDFNANKYVLAGSADGFKQLLEYLNKLVKEGLLDPESFTQTDDQARQKVAQGKTMVISGNDQHIVNEYKSDLSKIPGAKMVKIPWPIGPMGEMKTGTKLENGIMISKKARDSKNFVAMMQLVDWLWYSDAGNEFTKWGVEGVTYTKDGSGKRTLAKEIDVVGMNPGAPKHLQRDFGFYNGVFSYGGTTELLNSFFSPEEQEFQKVMNARKTLAVPPAYPFTDEEREQITLIETPLYDTVYQNALKFALGSRGFDQWDAFQTELKGKQADKYMDMVTKAYERFKQKNG